jgi:hypothetical protein
MALDGCAPGHRPAMILTWKTLLLASLLFLQVLLARRILAAHARRAFSIHRAIGMLAVVGALVVSLVITKGYLLARASPDVGWWSANRWGFMRTFPANTDVTMDPHNDEIPSLRMVTNSQSFRDGEWIIPPPDDGTIRVLLAGDSTIMGLSLPEKADTLDARLESRLSTPGSPRWDVWNLANTPASLWYFAEVILRAAPDARPRYAILYVNCSQDVFFLDEQRALADKPSWFYPAARLTGVRDDVLQLSANPWPFSYETSDPEVKRFALEPFERLLRYAASHGLHLVVWEAPEACAFLQPYRNHSEVTFLDWKSSGGRLCDRGEEGGRFCPGDGYPSGHLTPAGISHVADVMAPVLRDLEARASRH